MDAAALAQIGFASGRADAAATRVKTAAATGAEAKARAVAEDFEAVFIASLLENMGRDVQDGSGFFGGGNGEAMFRSLMNQEIGKKIAANGGLGIADSVYRFIIQAQEV